MEELVGFIDSIIFTNEENGFTVAKLQEKQKQKLTYIVGIMPSLQPGETLLCEGSWTLHLQYGKQFSVSNYTIKAPNDLIGIQKYLESGLVKGIGPVYAQKIVDKFGLDTLDILEKEINKLLLINGIGEKKIEKIKKCWNEQKSIRDVMIFLRSFDVSPSFAQKIYKKYGNESIRKVKDNPYQLAKEVIGIGFKNADKIAQKMGIEKTSNKRIEAGIEFTLWELTSIGHTCYPQKEFLNEAQKTLDVDGELLSKSLNVMIKNKQIIKKPSLLNEEIDFIWLHSLYHFEEEIAKKLMEIKNSSCCLRKIEMERALLWVEEKLKIKLAKNQMEAVQKAVSDKIHIITGGPGTGKSTITKAIIEITEQLTNKIVLAAPTGKAAKRMSQITHKKAFTIHSLLEFDFLERKFKRNEKNPVKAQLIIIDEASMIDTLLMYHLLKAIPSDARVIFVGDINQLPSIGPGYVLKDMINSKTLETTELKEIFRQAKGSKIITNAHKINQGYFPDLITQKSDFLFFEEKSLDLILSKILNLLAQELPQNHKFDPFNDIQVLSPMKKGLIGTENLNLELQNKLNPSSSPFYKNGKRFHLNDKVMQIKNNYDKNVYNGDVGKIVSLDTLEQEMIISFDNRDIVYDFTELDEIILAYAVSVHKYQGSECPCIVMPIHTTHFKLLYRNLLYTAITRGKKLVVLIGTKQAIAICIKNDEVLKRFTGLEKALLESQKNLIKNIFVN